MSKKPAFLSARQAKERAPYSMNQESIMQRTRQFLALSVFATAVLGAGWAQAADCSNSKTNSLITATDDLSDLACPDQWAPLADGNTANYPDLRNTTSDSYWNKFGIWSQDGRNTGKDKYYSKSFRDAAGNPTDAPTYGNLGLFGKDTDSTNRTIAKVANSLLGGILLTSDGIVFTWGWNGQGQLGLGMPYTNLPAKTTPGSKITASQWTNMWYSGGYKQVTFFLNPTALYDKLDAASPNNKSTRELTQGTIIIDVDAGYHHMIALDQQHRVWAWGYNQANQVGGCSSSASSSCKTAATYNFPQRVNGLPNNIVRVWANHGYLDRGQSFALTANGELWSWGSNSNGKRGNGGGAVNTAQPTPVYFGESKTGKPADATIIDVQGGDYHNMALDSLGRVWAWGDGNYFGDGSSGTVNAGKLLNLSDPKITTSDKRTIALPIQKIAMSYDNALILDSKGVVWQAGRIYVGGGSSNGGGAGTAKTLNSFKPVQYAQADVKSDDINSNTSGANAGYMPYARDIGAGESVSYIVDQHGRSWAWGDGRYHGFGREGDYIRSYTSMQTPIAHQYPQVIGDGDTQRYASDPTKPTGILSTPTPANFKPGTTNGDLGKNVDTPTDNRRYGSYGFNSLHPTVYDVRYQTGKPLVSPGIVSPDMPYGDMWKSLAFQPIPKIKKILGSRSGYAMIDTDGNLWRWAYDGSATIAWGNGDFFDQWPDNTGNGRDGNYDSYCYEVMLANLTNPPPPSGCQPKAGEDENCQPTPVIPCELQAVPNLMTNGSTSSVGGSGITVNTSAVVYAADRKFSVDSATGVGSYTGDLYAYTVETKTDPVTHKTTTSLKDAWNGPATASTNPVSRTILTAKQDSHTSIPFQWAGTTGGDGLTDKDVPNAPTQCTNTAGQNVDCSAKCMDMSQDPPVPWSASVAANKCPPQVCTDNGILPPDPGAGNLIPCIPPLGTPPIADADGTSAVAATRSQKLGAVVNSQLVYVGQPTLLNVGASYLNFAKAVNKFETSGTAHYRLGMVYVVANDSMLHGFDAGRGSSMKADGKTLGDKTDYGYGTEVFAYVPRAMLKPLLRTSSNNTINSFWVDGGVFSGDAQLDHKTYASVPAEGNWATVLAGTLGSGAPGYFVLDVTNPKEIKENTNIVIVDTTVPNPPPNYSLPGILPVAADTGTIGYQSSLPVMDQYNLTRQSTQITRINTKTVGGEWAVIMGNGYNSLNGLPVLLIQSISAKGRPLYTVAAKCWVNGAEFKPNSADPNATTPCQSAGNGLSAPRVVDVDGNGTADFVYAGDLMGNLWKFDISSVEGPTDPTKWKVTYGGQPMFTAVGPTGKPQPITSAPVAVAYPSGGFMVGFGTGKSLDPSDLNDASDADGNPLSTAKAPLNSFYALYDGQQIDVTPVEIGSTDPKTLTSMITLGNVPANLVPLCKVDTSGSGNRYSSCLRQRTDDVLLSTACDPTQPASTGCQGLSSSPVGTEKTDGYNTGFATKSGNLGWYYDIPEIAGSAKSGVWNAAKVLDNPAMMANNVVQFFSVNVPVASNKPITYCDDETPPPQPLVPTNELLVSNYFSLFTGAPADNFTLTWSGTYSSTNGNQRNRFLLPFGKYVRSGPNSFVKASDSGMIRYNAPDPAGKRAGWRIGR